MATGNVFANITPRASVPSQTFNGDATYTTPGLGACEQVNVEGQLVAAINAEQFGNPARSRDGIWCGQCVEVNATRFGTSVIVQIVDRAQGKTGHLVLSATVSLLSISFCLI